jgi:hypothetical protein
MSFTLKNLPPKKAARSQSGLQRVIIAVALAAAVGGGSVSVVSPARSDVALRLTPTVTDVSGTDLALSGVLLAQAGSVGGSVAPPAAGGREGKSISGGEPAVQAPPKAAKTKKPQQATKRKKPEAPVLNEAQTSQKAVTGEATSPPGVQGAKCTYAMDRSAEKACARCKKEIGATASCTRAHGGCNAKGQYGGLAYGLDYEKNWGALGSKVQDTRSPAYAAWDAIKACNQSAEKRGASCKLVRTWGEGCQYIVACCKSLQQ